MLCLPILSIILSNIFLYSPNDGIMWKEFLLHACYDILSYCFGIIIVPIIFAIVTKIEFEIFSKDFEYNNITEIFSIEMRHWRFYEQALLIYIFSEIGRYWVMSTRHIHEIVSLFILFLCSNCD